MHLKRLLLLPILLAGVSVAQSTNFPVGPQYLITTGTTEFLRPIATPGTSLNAPLPPLPSLPQIGPVVTDQPYAVNSALEEQSNLFPIYYGYPELATVVVIAGSARSELPASLNDTGFASESTPQWSREHGYGESLAQTSVYLRVHSRPVVRVYTNEDIERLRSR